MYRTTLSWSVIMGSLVKYRTVRCVLMAYEKYSTVQYTVPSRSYYLASSKICPNDGG